MAAKPQKMSQSAGKAGKIAAKITGQSGAKTAPAFPPDAPPETTFTITATQPAGPPHALKHGDTFVVLDVRGDIGTSFVGSSGLFYDDTRHLSRLELLLNDKPPLLLGSNLRDDNTAFFVDLTNPDLIDGQRLVMEKDRVHILRTIFIWRDTAYQRLGMRNYGDQPIDLRLTILFENDFADLFEVRGSHRERHGTATAKVHGGNRVLLAYDGLDGKVRQTALDFDPLPDQLKTDAALYHVHLKPGETRPLFLAISCDRNNSRPVPFLRGLIAARREVREATRQRTSVETSNDRFNEILCRSAADLGMLMTETPQGRYPYAGIPWYSTTFGRDGLITALQMLWWSPEVARGVLRRLAAYQATRYDPLADAEPGKILHEMRGGEMAALREVPFGLYYGSVDSTRYSSCSPDSIPNAPAIATLSPNFGPRSKRRSAGSTVQAIRTATASSNMSAPAIRVWLIRAGKIRTMRSFTPMGGLPRAPSHLLKCRAMSTPRNEWRRAARAGLAAIIVAERLDAEAARLAERFEAAFWCPDIETYALALDGNKEPCRVRTSNAGQVLFTGIAASDRAARVAAGLLRPNFFSGWGIRTVARGEPRFNPMSYHNGSIWPHDNALIALGMARYEAKRPIETLFGGLFSAATYMDQRRLPELFCGFQRQRGHGPTLYPVACSPQAWASATPFTLLEASLGLEFDPFAREIRLRNPRLPEFLDEVTLRDLQLASSSVDLRVRRHGHTVSLDTPRINGDIRVSVVFSS